MKELESQDKLAELKKLIKNDEDLLHSYLTANGYIFNKA